jgi:hypothetical protein
VDIGVTEQRLNPEYRSWYRSTPTPALIDVETRQAVTITGTIAQAEADLSRAISNAVPGIAHYKGKDQRDEARKEVAKLRDVEAMLMDAEQRIARLKSAVNRGRPYP